MARNPGTNQYGGSFDEATIEAVWRKGTPEPQYAGFRKDKCGASMQRGKYGQTVQWGWEIDHINPVDRRGRSVCPAVLHPQRAALSIRREMSVP